MARIPYADITDPDIAPAAAKIGADHGSVTHLHRILLHSPTLAVAWRGLIQAVRRQCNLPADVREVITLRVAFLNHAHYAIGEHTPLALKAGLTQPQVDALAQPRVPAVFDARMQAIIAYIDAMTIGVQVPDDVFAAVRGLYAPRELVELSITIASYNMVSRMAVAFQVNNHDPLP